MHVIYSKRMFITISRTSFLVAKIKPAILIMIMIHFDYFRFQQPITPNMLTHNYVSDLLIEDRITTEYDLLESYVKGLLYRL